MTQIELEARLAENEANFQKEITPPSVEIRQARIEIERAHETHDAEVSRLKQRILVLESEIAVSRQKHAAVKAEIFKNFQLDSQVAAGQSLTE